MLSTKARTVVLGLISLCAAAAIAIGVETTKGVLFEIRKSLADMEAAKAAYKVAEAQNLDAINKLKAAVEIAIATKEVGQLQSRALLDSAIQARIGQEVSARTTAEGLKAATGIQMHPENSMYDSVTGPMFGDPARRINELNEKIVLLQQEAKRGYESGTRRVLSASERAKRAADAQVLEDELAIVTETSSKNIKDMIGMFVGGSKDSSGGIFGSLFSSGNEKPVQRVIREEP